MILWKHEKRGWGTLPWYGILAILCVVIGPFEALYQYIKAQKRRDELKRRRERENKRPGSY